MSLISIFKLKFYSSKFHLKLLHSEECSFVNLLIPQNLVSEKTLLFQLFNLKIINKKKCSRKKSSQKN